MDSHLDAVQVPPPGLPSQSTLDSEVPPSFDVQPHLDSNAAFAPPPPPPPPAGSSTLQSRGPQRRRRSSKSVAVSGVKRSESTPNMQAESLSQQEALAAEKKRNKLGYHRTSVACVHCRRRKIRCLLAPEDLQGRCQNCIRLKKECHFFPVDQQPATERQRKPLGKGVSQSSSPPAPPNISPTDQFAQYSPTVSGQSGYPPLASMHHSSTMPVSPLDTTNFASPLRSNTWDASYMESPMSAGPHMSEAGTQGLWPRPSPIETGGYLPYSAAPDSARSTHFHGGYPPPQRQESWPSQPLPSSHLPHQHQSSHAQMQPLTHTQSHPGAGQQQTRSMSLQHDAQGMYGGVSISSSPFFDARGPPSLHASTGSPATSVSLSDATTAPGQTQAAMHYGLPPQWDPSKAGMDYGAPPPPGAWYAETIPEEHSQGWPPGVGQGQGVYKQWGKD